ncbi:MAG: DUF2793 domain-containing protein [Proteobacteria bacterium]|nr:DUF2793 domain-containing protein [Pseudomonadota bacterium]
MTDTPNLALPYILPSQAQKHVTHNEAIRALDCLVQLAVESRSLAAPPASPAEGSRYLVAAAAATGDWSGHSEEIAAFQDGTWMFYEPREGWIAWVADDHELAIYSAGAWAAFTSGGGGGGSGGDPDGITELDDLAHLGINATADTTNRLALKSPASLFDNEGAGHQQKINKHAAGDTASVLYQTNYSGRAEMGLAGDDDFHFKVSPDGATWYEALKIDRNSGKLSFPSLGGPRETLTADRTYYVRADGSDSNTGRANTFGGAFLTIQKAYDVIASTLDLGGFKVAISIGAGTFAGGLLVAQPWSGGGSIIVTGAGSSTIISTTNKDAISNTSSLPGAMLVQNMTLQTTTGGGGLVNYGVGTINFGGITFGACATYHAAAIGGSAVVQAVANYSITGGAISHLFAATGGSVFVEGLTLTLTGTPAFVSAFARALSLGAIIADGLTFSGAATGARYAVLLNAIINTVTGNVNYFPGNSAGSAASGGQYA